MKSIRSTHSVHAVEGDERIRTAVTAPSTDAAYEDSGGCPNGPDEYGNWPCDPKGYFGVAECQTCGRIARWHEVARAEADRG